MLSVCLAGHFTGGPLDGGWSPRRPILGRSLLASTESLRLSTTAGFVRYVCREVIRHGDTIGCAGLDGGPEGVLGTDCAVVWAGQAHGVLIGTGEHSTFSQIPAVVLQQAAGRLGRPFERGLVSQVVMAP